jgi:hypothetical protein
MVEQGTHKPLVSSSNLLVATSRQPLDAKGKLCVQRIVTPVVWAFAPEWLTVREASELSGYDEATIRVLVQDGALDTKRGLIEKASLREFREALWEVLHWHDDREPPASRLDHNDRGCRADGVQPSICSTAG